MPSTETALEADEVVLALVVLARVIGHYVLAESATEGQLLQKPILQETIRPGGVLLAQIVDVDDQAARLLCNHRPDVGRVDALVFLWGGMEKGRGRFRKIHAVHIYRNYSPHRRESPGILAGCLA